MTYNGNLTKAGNSACENFAEAEGNLPLGEMLKLTQVAFERETDQLVDCVTKGLTASNAELKREGKLPQVHPWQVDNVRMDERAIC